MYDTMSWGDGIRWMEPVSIIRCVLQIYQPDGIIRLIEFAYHMILSVMTVLF